MKRLIGWLIEVPRAARCSIGLPEGCLEELLEKRLEKMALKRWQEEKGMREAELLADEQPSKI